MSWSWTFPVGYPCEDPAQLGALETVNSKPISRANHGASGAAVVVAMLCSRSEGCELLTHILSQGWPPARAVVTSGADLPDLGISPCTYVRGGFPVSAPHSGQKGFDVLKCGLNSDPQHSICRVREGNYISVLLAENVDGRRQFGSPSGEAVA